ncbi:MAG: methyltransferase domain-containing protein [Deltaproteobacteria bacterium]|nr:methyltransferase domain-containing protein [Deltaproteobacteria bacterium]
MADGAQAQQTGVIGVFNRAAATYDRIGPQFFAHFGKLLVERAHLMPGADVLDVATGRGAVLFPAGERVGARGRVWGTDLSAGMVRETLADIRKAGWPNVSIHQMDAEQLDFPAASFDRVLCGFSLWFFPRPHRALEEFFRVLRPGGQVGLTTWTADCPFICWFLREMADSLPPQAAPAPGSPEPPRFDASALLEAALVQAGFVDIRITSEEADFVYPEEEEWWLSLWSHGIRARLEELDAPTLAKVKAHMLRKVRALQQADGIHTLFRAFCALATKPAS